MRSLRDAATGVVSSERLTPLLDWLLRADRGRPDRAVVLTYHRIDEAAARPWLWPALLSATPAGFAEQMTLIAERMRPISLADLAVALERGRRLPRRSVAVTIDDAYAGVEQYALPVLRGLGIPATLFVATALPGAPHGFWWDRVYHAVLHTDRRSATVAGAELPLDGADRAAVFRRIHDRLIDLPHRQTMEEVERLLATLTVEPAAPEVLDWDALRGAHADGFELAPHSDTHPRLDRVDPEVARHEVIASTGRLRELTGRMPVAFAFPGGFWSDAAAQAARQVGLRTAFTTRRAGIELAVAESFALPRINVGRRANANVLRLQLGSWMRLAGR